MFKGTEPLSGKYLDYLDEAMLKNAKDKPTDFFSKNTNEMKAQDEFNKWLMDKSHSIKMSGDYCDVLLYPYKNYEMLPESMQNGILEEFFTDQGIQTQIQLIDFDKAFGVLEKKLQEDEE